MDKKLNYLDKARESAIIHQTSHLLDSLNYDGHRVDIVKLATELGFKVFRLVEKAPFSGLIIVNTDGNEISKYIPYSKIIAYKYSLTEESNRFIIAHELGHYFLHCNDFTNGTNIFKYEYHYHEKSDETKEMEADFFAANILVPKEAFIVKYNSLNDMKDTQIGIEELARYFGVSPACIQRRMEEVFGG